MLESSSREASGEARHFCVRTASGSDRIRKSHWVSKVPPDPVATARGSDTDAALVPKDPLLD